MTPTQAKQLSMHCSPGDNQEERVAQRDMLSIMLQLNMSIWMVLSKSPMTKIISCISLESSAVVAMLQ